MAISKKYCDKQLAFTLFNIWNMKYCFNEIWKLQFSKVILTESKENMFLNMSLTFREKGFQ